MALLVLLRERWSARRDAQVRFLKLQLEIVRSRLPGNRVIPDPVERKRLMETGAEMGMRWRIPWASSVSRCIADGCGGRKGEGRCGSCGNACGAWRPLRSARFSPVDQAWSGWNARRGTNGEVLARERKAEPRTRRPPRTDAPKRSLYAPSPLRGPSAHKKGQP